MVRRSFSLIVEALQAARSDVLDIGLFLPSPYMAEATAMVVKRDRWRPACF